MTPHDARLLDAVADVNATLDRVTTPTRLAAVLKTMDALTVSESRREELAAAFNRGDSIIPVENDAERRFIENVMFFRGSRKYLGVVRSIDEPAALRFNAVRSMGRE